jgi:nucleoside-diphosphate-sugar epimerase
MKKILVTGGKGFIGGLLVERLRALGHDVATFDLADGQDLLDRQLVLDAVRGRDIVFHLAAIADLVWAAKSDQNLLTTVEVNCLGVLNVAYACAVHGALLNYASTCCVYGNQTHHPEHELTMPNPSEIYAYTKLAGEEIIKGLAISRGLSFNIMRYATIYGENMRDALAVSVFFRQAMQNQPITVHGDGMQTRTLTYVSDLIDAHIALLNSDVRGETFNFSTEEEVSVLETAQRIKKLTGSSSPITFTPQRTGQTFQESISAQKARDMLGWKAQISFDEGLAKTYAWFKNTNH